MSKASIYPPHLLTKPRMPIIKPGMPLIKPRVMPIYDQANPPILIAQPNNA